MVAAQDIRCAICGKMIHAGCTCNRDHIIPQAVYKWAPGLCPDMTPEEYRSLAHTLRGAANVCITHIRCNAGKEDTIPEIGALHVSAQKRTQIWRLHNQVFAHILRFQRFKRRLLKAQRGCCLRCGIPLDEGGVLRRRRTDRPRVPENACLLCGPCNRSKETENLPELQTT